MRYAIIIEQKIIAKDEEAEIKPDKRQRNLRFIIFFHRLILYFLQSLCLSAKPTCVNAAKVF